MTGNIKESLQKILLEYDEILPELFINLPYGVLIVTPSGDIVFYNPEAERILDVSIFRMDSFNLWSHDLTLFDKHQRSIPHTQQPAAISFNTGKSVKDTIMGMGAKDAQKPEVWLKVSSVPYKREGNDKPRLLCLLFSDITESFRNELKVRESESILRSVVDSNFGDISLYNPAGFTLRQDSVVGSADSKPWNELHLLDLVHVEYREQVWEVFADVIQSGKNVSVIHQSLAADNSYRWFETVFSPVFSDDKVIKVTAFSTDIHDSKTARDQIRYQAELLNKVNQSVITTDLQGRITYANDLTESIYGWSAKELRDENIIQLLVPENSLERSREIFAELKQGRSWHGEFTMKHKEGTAVTALVSYSPLLNSKGEVYGVLGVSNDISKYKYLESAFSSLEWAYKLMFMQNPLPMFIFDAQTLRFMEVNNVAIDTYGYSREEFLELTIRDIRPEEDQRAFQKLIDNLDPGLTNHGVWRHRKKNGEIIFVEVMSHQMDYLSKDAMHVLVMDVTRQKKATDALIASETKFRTLYENMMQGVVYHDQEGRIVSANNAALDILGLKIDKIRGKTSQSSLMNAIREDGTPLKGEEHPSMIALRSGNRLKDRVLGALHPDKESYIWISVDAVPLFEDGYKEPRGVFSTFTDITQKKESARIIYDWKERYEKVTAASDQVVYENNLSRNTLTWEGSVHKVLGYRAIELNGDYQKWTSIVHPDDLPNTRKILQQTIANRTNYRAEYRVRHEKGHWIHVKETSILLEQHHGDDLILIGVIQDITESKNFARALEVSMTRFKAIFNSTFQFMGLMEPDGTIIEANQTFLDFMQIKPPQVINRYLWNVLEDMIPPRDFAFMKEAFAKAGKGEFIRYNLHLAHPVHGNTVVDFSLTPVFDSDGKTVIMLIPEGRDITQLRKQEEMARILEGAFMKSTLGVTIVDYKHPDMPLVRVNEAFENITGYKASEILGKNMRFLQGSETQQPKLATIRKALQTGTECRVELVNYTKQGEKFWNELYLAPVSNQHGEVTHYVGMMQNITQKKIEQQELEQYRESLEQLVDMRTQELSLSRKKLLQTQQIAKLGSWEYDLQTSMMVLSEEFSKMLNVEYQDTVISFRYYLRLLLREDAVLLIQKIRQIKYKEISSDSFELRHIDAAGNMYYLFHSVMHTIDDLGREMVLGSVLDVTAQKAFEEELKQAYLNAEQANKTKSIFLANMSHEIRTPLNAIIGFSDILLSSFHDSKQKSQILSIKNSGKSLLQIINDILDLSKIEAGKMNVKKEPSSLEVILNEIEIVFGEKADAKGVKFFIEREKSIPRSLLVDPVRVQQVLLNLVGNAIKFTHQGYVALTIDNARKTANKLDLIFKVEDTGIGIAADELDAIYKPFYQQRGQSESIYGGTGLGLTISKKMIEAMNGTITVQSEPDKGSLFEVVLLDVEISGDDLWQESMETAPRLSIEFGPATLLIVDDNAENRKLLADLLEGPQMKIYFAENGKQAVKTALSQKPDLILMDLRMPVVNGYEATKIIKMYESLKNIPIVGISASSKMLSSERTDIQIFDDFLLKPLNVSVLLNVVKKYLSHSVVDSANRVYKQATLDRDYVLQRKEKMQGLIHTLEEKFIPWHEKVQKKQLIDDIHTFGKALYELGEQNDFTPLCDFSQLIVNLSLDFEIDELTKTLSRFPGLVEELKLILEE